MTLTLESIQEPTTEELQQSYLEWVSARVDILIEDGAEPEFCDGFRDAALGRDPKYAKYSGDPFGADRYHSGFGVGEYTCGPPETVELETVITQDGSVLSWVA